MPVCPAGNNGPGGKCDCSGAKEWVEGQWPLILCSKGNCFARQDYDQCKNKNNGHQLGDGTWCWDRHRDTKCSTIQGIID